MAKAIEPGDKVQWKSHGGTAQGKVVKKITPQRGSKVTGGRLSSRSAIRGQNRRRKARCAQAGSAFPQMTYSAASKKTLSNMGTFVEHIRCSLTSLIRFSIRPA